MKDASNPFSYHYEPEVDISESLDPEMASYYLSLIGIIRWMVELRRIDIVTELSMLLSKNEYPRKGYFVDDLHIMSDLKGNTTIAWLLTRPFRRLFTRTLRMRNNGQPFMVKLRRRSL